MSKTNAVRILEAAGIIFSTYEYEVDENDLSGLTVAKKINADADAVFKTLVARNEANELFVFCIPVTTELHLKKAAKAADSKSIALIQVKELLPLTGYIRGGCSPVGMKKKFPTFIDETAQLFETIFVSAGVRGMQIRLAPLGLQKITEAKFADLT
ncbi:MAG: Cys-tRNA(Pro) deacylase [Ignavibacteriaceae bacterium]|jgi:Cys-tRNA(Pro)/Cys-tRNA(Cys) deacylase|nr:Cys-tRNA(Pro) deacylase [Ignavibacteriaceae bacterium]